MHFLILILKSVYKDNAACNLFLQPLLFDVLVYLCGVVGLIVHYLIPHLRKEMPWMCCSQPLLVSHERSQFEVKGETG